MIKLTLTPNRSTPEQYVRYIEYFYGASGRLFPLGINRGQEYPIEWSQIGRGNFIDHEFAALWGVHLAKQEIHSLSQHSARERLIASGHIKPKEAKKWTKSFKAFVEAHS